MRIGLTGSIAAGKSTLSRFFVSQDVALWDADRASREVVQPGRKALGEIVESFGSEILQEDGQLNRAMLGKIIFAQEEKRKRLNEIVHPAVFQDMRRSIQMAKEQGEKMIVLDIPLLFETDMQNEMDMVCLVYCEDDVRLRRLMARDELGEEEAKRRMASQMPQERKKELADYIIDNSGTPEETLKQAETLLRLWREEADRAV